MCHILYGRNVTILNSGGSKYYQPFDSPRIKVLRFCLPLRANKFGTKFGTHLPPDYSKESPPLKETEFDEDKLFIVMGVMVLRILPTWFCV